MYNNMDDFQKHYAKWKEPELLKDTYWMIPFIW